MFSIVSHLSHILEGIFKIESIELCHGYSSSFGSTNSSESFVAIFSVWEKKNSLFSMYILLFTISVKMYTIFCCCFLFFCRKNTETTYQEAVLYAVGILLLNAISALANNHFLQAAIHISMRCRAAVVGLVYSKTLRLSQTSLTETSSGKLINLLSNDVGRFDFAHMYYNYLWIAPLFTFIVACYLWFEIGFSGLIGIGIIFTIMPILSKIHRSTTFDL